MEIISPGYESYIIVKQYDGAYIYLVDIINKYNPLNLRKLSPPDGPSLALFLNGKGLAYNSNYILTNVWAHHHKSNIWLVYDIKAPGRLMPLGLIG